jgi:hypothetical protein
VDQLDTVNLNRYFSYSIHCSQHPVARIEMRSTGGNC